MKLNPSLSKSRSFIFFVLVTLIWNLSAPVWAGDEIACDEICQIVVSGVSDADWYVHTGNIKLRCETAGQLGEQCLAYEQVYSGEMWNAIVLALTVAAAAKCVEACALQLAGNPLGAAAMTKCATLGFTQLATEAAATVALHWNNLFLGQGSGKDIAAAWLSVGAFAVGGGLKMGSKMSGIGSGLAGLSEAGEAMEDLDSIIEGSNRSDEERKEAADEAKDVKEDLTHQSEIGLGEGVTGGAALTGFVASKSVGFARHIQSNSLRAKGGGTLTEKQNERFAKSKEKQEKAEACMAAGIFTTMLGFRVAEQAILPKLKSDFCDVIESLGPHDGLPMANPCVDASPTSSPTANPTSTSSSMEMIYRSHSLQARVAELQLRFWLDQLSQSLWINQALGAPVASHKVSRVPNISQLFQSCQSEGGSSCSLLNNPVLKGSLVTFPPGQDFSEVISIASDVSTQLSMTPSPRASDLLRYSIRNQSLPDRPQLPIEGIFAFADIVQDNAEFLKKEVESKVHHSMFNVPGFQDRQWNSNRKPTAMQSQAAAVVKRQPPHISGNLPALSPIVLTALDVADADVYHATTILNIFQIVSLRVSLTIKQWPTSQGLTAGASGKNMPKSRY